MEMVIKIVTIIGTIIGIIADCQSIKHKKKLNHLATIIVIVCVTLIIVDIFLKQEAPMASEISIENEGTMASEISIENEGTIATEINIENYYEVKEKEYNEEITGRLIFDDDCNGFDIALIDNIPYLALYEDYYKNEWVELSLSNKNDINIAIDNIYVDVLSYKPCKGDIYCFTPNGCGGEEVQYFYSQIEGERGLQRLNFCGTNIENKNQNNGMYLKLEAGDVEKCRINLECIDPGVYTIQIKVDYTLGKEKKVFYTDQFKVYLENNSQRNELSYVESMFILRQIYNYLYTSEIPMVYKNGLERELKEHQNRNSTDIEGFLIEERRTCEAFIACHYIFWDEQNQTLDLLKYLEAISTNLWFTPWSDNKDISIVYDFTMEEYARRINNSLEDIKIPWIKVKNKDYDYNEYKIPFCSLKDENPYAQILNVINEADGNITIYGNVESIKKGKKNFKCILCEKDYKYYVSSIEYYK